MDGFSYSEFGGKVEEFFFLFVSKKKSKTGKEKKSKLVKLIYNFPVPNTLVMGMISNNLDDREMLGLQKGFYLPLCELSVDWLFMMPL